jgi:arsenate reductase
MKKIYHLSTCSTCKRIIHELQLNNDFEFHDVKQQPITETQLDELKNLAGGYEKIFSKIAMKYRMWGLNKMQLSEVDYRKYILDEYTFIKRPVIVINNKIFIGSSRPVITKAKEMIEASRR